MKKLFMIIICFTLTITLNLARNYNVSAATNLPIDDSFLPYVFKDGIIENEFDNNVYITEDNELFTLRDGLKIDDAYPDLIDDITYHHMAGYYDFTYINDIFHPLLISLPYIMGDSTYSFTLYKISFYNLSGSPFIHKTITIQAEPLNNRIWIYVGYPCRINVDYITNYPTNYIFDNTSWGTQDDDGYWHTQFGQIPYPGGAFSAPTVTYSNENHQLASDTVIKASIIAYRSIGYDNGYNDGYQNGYDDGYQDGLNVDYDEIYENGYNVGYQDGYQDGYNTGISGTITTNWFTSFVNSVFDIFNIEIFPNVRLAYLFFIPIGLGILFLIFKLIKG